MSLLRTFTAVFILVFICAFFIPGYLNKDYPQDYFKSPVKHEILLSGTFGELRSNHFHSGIDIKPSKGIPGDPVMASADGYISRIFVSSGGYGNALYLNHPNGYTTVYGHLDRFNPAISEYVKKRQYEKKSFAVNLFPNPAQFTIQQGNLIGYMGTSGSSNGTHLHFEIRKSDNSKPINPLGWGLPVSDHIPPELRNLALYSQSEAGYNLFRNIPLENWRNGDTISVNIPKVAVGIEAFDRSDQVPNKNGIYGIKLFWDKIPSYELEFTEFHFNQTRYINSHIDYPTRFFEKRMIHRLFNLPGNHFELCRQLASKSTISLENGDYHQLLIQVSDRLGNQKEIKAVIRGTGVRQKIYSTSDKPVFHYNQPFSVGRENLQANFAPGSIYQDLFFDYYEADDKSSDIFSKVYQIHHPSVPLHRYFDLWIKPVSLPANLREKAFLALCGRDGIVNYGGKWENNGIQSRSRSFGQYCVMIDTIPPKIEPIIIPDELTEKSKFVFKVTENIPVAGDAKGIQYLGTIDQKWVLTEYDAKNDLILYRHQMDLSRGEHIFKLEVKDDRNNSTVFTKSIFVQ